VKVGNSQEGWSSPNFSLLSPCIHPIYGLSICFVVAITMFVLCCKNEDERFMLQQLEEHQENTTSPNSFFASPICMFVCLPPLPLFYN